MNQELLIKWRHFTNTHIMNTTLGPKEPAQDGLPANFIKQFWRTLQAMWLSRNRIKHDTEAEGTTANTILLRGAITHEYTWG